MLCQPPSPPAILPGVTPSEFAAKWAGSQRTERAAAQEHFSSGIPCYAAGYEGASPRERRASHRALGHATRDPDRAAWHRAAAATRPSTTSSGCVRVPS